MKSSTKEKKLREIARKAHLYLEDDGYCSEQDWRDIIAESLNVIDKRSGLGWMTLARVNRMIDVVETNGTLQWRRGRLFNHYLQDHAVGEEGGTTQQSPQS